MASASKIEGLSHLEALQGVKEYDRRMTLIHEHAHAAVAEHFGMTTSITIEENPNGSLVGERFYVGRTTALGLNDWPPKVRRKIGLAGIVAEAIHRDHDTWAEAIWDSLELEVEELSSSDAELAGDYGPEDIQETLELVRSLWPAIMKRTREWN